MAIDLAAAIAAQQQQWEAEKREDDARREKEQARLNRDLVERSEQLLHQFLGEDLIAQLRPEATARPNVYTFVFEDVPYTVIVRAVFAELYTPIGSHSPNFADPVQFIRALAVLHPQSKAQLDRTRAKTEQRAAQLATHAQLAERVNEATAAAPRWQWPEGREITIFRWQWCTAPAGEYGSAEYDGGWSTEGTLGVLLKLGAERSRGERDLYLAPSCMPISSRIPIACLGDLPPDLREPDLLIIPGIRYDYEAQDLDGDPILVAEPFGELKVQLGQRPVAWVRALLEADQ